VQVHRIYGASRPTIRRSREKDLIRVKQRGHVGALNKVLNDADAAIAAGDAEALAAAETKEDDVVFGRVKQVTAGGKTVKIAQTKVDNEGGGAMPKGASRRGNKRGG